MRDIAVERLFCQQLAYSKFKLPGDVVSWLGAIQAQDYAGAKWSIGLRLSGSTEAGIEKALNDKAIIRTWAMRGTLHFIAAADVRWMLELLAPRVIAGNASRYKQLGLDKQTFVQSNAVLVDALQNGKQMTRKELLPVLRQNGISTEGQRAPYILQRASIDGLICQVSMRRNDPVYMLLDNAVPGGRKMKREDALAELARRYFKSRGPATLKDYIWWSGLTAADARAGLEAIKLQLSSETIDGEIYWLDPTIQAENSVPSNICLLPSFDEYLIGYKDRSASLVDPQYKKLSSLSTGMPNPTVIKNGRVVGIWKRTLKKQKVILAIKPFNALSAADLNDLKEEELRYGEYIGLSVEIQKYD